MNHGLTWLATAPKIKLLPQTDAREPYPLNWDEQERLFAELPFHLKKWRYLRSILVAAIRKFVTYAGNGKYHA